MKPAPTTIAVFTSEQLQAYSEELVDRTVRKTLELVRNHHDDVLDLKEAAAVVGVSTPTLVKYAKSGAVPAMRVGVQWRFRRSDLLNLTPKAHPLNDTSPQQFSTTGCELASSRPQTKDSK